MSEQREMPFLTQYLAMIARTLAMVPTQQLSDYVDKCHIDLSYADAVGPILEPTGYRDALQSGQLDDARNQLEIVDALLTVRMMIDKREAFVAEHAQKKLKP